MVVAAVALAAPAQALAGGSTTQKGLPGALEAGAPTPQASRLSSSRATQILLEDDKVADWLDHYPPGIRSTDATYSRGTWTVKVWAGKAGEVATGRIDDVSGAITDGPWTGPQVAWKMARGSNGAFGGRKINSLPIWLGFCVLFLIGLADFRRPLSLRNLDLLAMLSFSVSLWFFNKGDIFTSV